MINTKNKNKISSLLKMLDKEYNKYKLFKFKIKLNSLMPCRNK